jgi:hypothetical protein
LREFDLNVDFCVGVAPDGCSVTTSQKVGAVKEEARNAVNCACYNHALNLPISVFSTVLSIRHSHVIKEAISFLTFSAKCSVIVNSILEQKIIKLCETRWTEQIESTADFSSSLEAIIGILDEILEWEDATASSKAKSLTMRLTKFEFLISLHCQVSVLHLFSPLSNIFQKT